MNSKIVFTILVVCLAQAYGRATSTTATPFVEVFNMGSDLLSQLHTSFLSVAGVKNDDELWNKAKDQIKTFESSLRSGVAKINQEIQPLQGKGEELVKTFTAKVTEVTDDIKARHPDLFSGDVTKLANFAESSLRTVIDESDKLRARLQAEGEKVSPKVEAVIKQVYDSAINTATDLKKQVDGAVNQFTKKN